MKKRRSTRQRQRTAAAAAGAAAAAAPAPAAPRSGTRSSPRLAVSPLWPLSSGFPGPALELVRSKLPAPTKGIVRLVCRAARDDFVDGRATRVRRLWEEAPLLALASAAPRLRSLESLWIAGTSTGAPSKLDPYLVTKDCVWLAEALERLPDGGARLRELRLCSIGVRRLELDSDARALQRLAAAVARLSGLTSVKLSIEGPWASGHSSVWSRGASDLLAAVAALPALAALGFSPMSMMRPPAQLRALLRPPGLLERLERLELSEVAAALALPALCKGRAAARLARLRDLSVDVQATSWRSWHSGAKPSVTRDPRLPALFAAAPWLPQLTRLALTLDGGVHGDFARPLAPGALPALRALRAKYTDDEPAAGELRALLAACGAAALEALELYWAPLDVLAAAADAAALPGLRALVIEFPQLKADRSAPGYYGEMQFSGAWGAFCAAPLAPLTRLEVQFNTAVSNKDPYGAAALGASSWARSLRELALGSWGGEPRDADDPDAPHGSVVLRSLQALSALAALTKLRISAAMIDADAFDLAADEGWADGWAPQLVEFRLGLAGLLWPDDTGMMFSLQSLPFSERLERVGIETSGVVYPDELEFLSASWGENYPQVTALEFAARRPDEEITARSWDLRRTE